MTADDVLRWLLPDFSAWELLLIAATSGVCVLVAMWLQGSI